MIQFFPLYHNKPPEAIRTKEENWVRTSFAVSMMIQSHCVLLYSTSGVNLSVVDFQELSISFSDLQLIIFTEKKHNEIFQSIDFSLSFSRFFVFWQAIFLLNKSNAEALWRRITTFASFHWHFYGASEWMRRNLGIAEKYLMIQLQLRENKKYYEEQCKRFHKTLQI